MDTFDHSWAEGAAYCAEWRYWQAKARALALPDNDPNTVDVVAFWDRSIDAWGTLLDMAFAHDPGAQARAVQWGLENHWAS